MYTVAIAMVKIMDPLVPLREGIHKVFVVKDFSFCTKLQNFLCENVLPVLT